VPEARAGNGVFLRVGSDNTSLHSIRMAFSICALPTGRIIQAPRPHEFPAHVIMPWVLPASLLQVHHAAGHEPRPIVPTARHSRFLGCPLRARKTLNIWALTVRGWHGPSMDDLAKATVRL